MITAEQMQLSLYNFFLGNGSWIIPNVYFGPFDGSHEFDLAVIRKSGYLVEVEIKRSVNDTIADSKKAHRHKDPHNRIAELYFAVPEEIYEKCLPYIPDHAGILSLAGESGKFVTRKRFAKRYPKCKPLELYEQLELVGKCCHKMWSLKRHILWDLQPQRKIKNGLLNK